MLSDYGHLPGGTVAGLDSINFWTYWNAIKDNIDDLRDMPNRITRYLMKMGTTVDNLEKKGRADMAALVREEAAKANDDLKKAWDVKQKIDKHLPEWIAAERKAKGSGAPIVAEMGVAPVVILGAVAIAALAIVGTVGMALHQKYQFEFKVQVLNCVKEGKCTQDEAGTILEAGSGGGVLNLDFDLTTIGIAAVAVAGILVAWRLS